MSNTEKIIVGISIGDLNGIGVEVILKTFEDKRMLDFCTPVLFGNNKVISFHKKILKLNNPTHGAQSLDKIVHEKINVINCWNEETKIELGKQTETGGKYALISLQKASQALKEHKIHVLVTAPINKENIQSETFKFPGHTEYFEEQFEGKSLMILLSESIRIGLITGHIPISSVSQKINSKLITEKVEIMHTSLQQDFNINRPKIAILGLNPHCGDKGVIGKEDDKIIRPTIQKIKETGKLVFGPYAADGFFGSKAYEQFDGILAMYHDQGLTPFKALSFGSGVNFTAGLNIIRTSPDHGTGFDISGKNCADPSSFKEALFTAISIYRNRNDYKELKNNALKTK